MSPGAKDFSSTRRTGGGGYELHAPCAGNGGRYSQPGFARPHLRPGFCHRPRAFTLIEIMIVVGIMGIVMTMSVPIVYKLWRKAPMRQAVKDIVEVCSHARARAILQGQVTEVVFHPKQNRLELGGGGGVSRPPDASSAEVSTSAPPATGSGLSAQLSQEIIIETLDINMSGVEFNDVDSARVRFYPNGTSDEMRMILFDGRDRMGIELEITTGLAGVVNNPLQEWTRR
jgi:prepilin-type N-terminal cleavage/methylation domain-containing protein